VVSCAVLLTQMNNCNVDRKFVAHLIMNETSHDASSV